MTKKNRSVKGRLASLPHKRFINKKISEGCQEDQSMFAHYDNLNRLLKGLTQPQSHFASLVTGNCLSKMITEPWARFFKGEKADFKYYEMESVVSAFYERVIDTYIGIDSILPSEFITKVHPYLLSSLTSTVQESSFPPSGKYCHGRHLVRILTVDVEKLQKDYRTHEDDFLDYLSYHEDGFETGGIMLLWVDPRVAEEAKIKRKIWSTDLGLWVRSCALLFDPVISPENEISLQLINPKSTRLSERNLFERCVKYTKDLINEARRLRWDGSIRPEQLAQEVKEDLLWSLDARLEPELTDAWPKFVNAKRRMKALEGEFLVKKVLKTFKQPKIFDAASGTGAETIWLKSEGYDITPNEIIWDFIQDAHELAKQLPKGRQKYETWAYDWRHLRRKAPESLFDIVLVMGNSLTCLLQPEEMKKCLCGFHHILKPNGLLVIDTRNYKNMFNDPKCQMHGFRFRQEVVYPSKEIRAKPGRMQGLSIPMILEYYDNGKRVGKWKVYAYDENEMKDLLEEKNLFSIEGKYFDFRDEPNPRKPAEFITYIARVKK